MPDISTVLVILYGNPFYYIDHDFLVIYIYKTGADNDYIRYGKRLFEK